MVIHHSPKDLGTTTKHIKEGKLIQYYKSFTGSNDTNRNIRSQSESTGGSVDEQSKNICRFSTASEAIT